MTESKDLSQAKVPEAGEPEVKPPKRRPARNRRRFLMVDKPYQLREMFYLIIISALMFFAGGGMGAYLAYYAVKTGSLMSAIGENIFFIIIEMLLLLGVVLPAASLLFTHPVAGPLFRVRKEMRRVAEGERGFRVHLRKGDQLTSLADTFNQMLQAIEVREGTISSNRSRAKETMENALQRIRDSHPELDGEVMLMLEEVKETLE